MTCKPLLRKTSSDARVVETKKLARWLGWGRSLWAICRPLTNTVLNSGPNPRNRDEFAFTARTVNGNAGDALERLRQIGVGQLADIFGRDGIDDSLRITFDGPCAGDAGANTGDHDFAQVAALRRTV